MTTAIVDLTGFDPRVWLAPWRTMARVAERCGYPVTVVPGHAPGYGQRKLRRLAVRAPRAVPAELRTRLAFGAGGRVPDADRMVWVLGSDYLVASLVQCLSAVPRDGRRHTIVFGEIWPRGADHLAAALEPVLGSVDVVTVAIRASVEPLVARGVPATYLPMAFDPAVAVARAPHERRIDVVNIGRRDPAQHDAVRTAVERANGYYHYDTLASDVCVELEQHAAFLGTLLGASRVSITNPAKFNTLTDRAVDELETPARLVEAASQGAIPAGWRNPAHDTDPYLSAIPWISLGTDASTWCEQLVQLLEDADLLADLATTCRSTALAAHTWAHRLTEVFEAVGVDVTTRLREERARWEESAPRPWGSLTRAHA